MKCEVLLISILICVLVSTTSADLKKEITEACKAQPKFTSDTQCALKVVGISLERPIGSRFAPAQVLSFTTIRSLACDDYPKIRNASYDDNVAKWDKQMMKLSEDLHTIDKGWFLYSHLKDDRTAFTVFNNTNNRNKNKVRDSLKKILQNKGASDTVVAKNLKRLLKYMNSAMANVRPGYARVNRAIGPHLDPLVKVGVNKTKLVDLTSHSISLKDHWNASWKNFTNGEGIVTSDITPDYDWLFKGMK